MSGAGDYVGHIRKAANDAISFVKDMDKACFLADRRTQNAVVMSLVIIGEAAAKVMDRYPGFADLHPNLPWRRMRGMRNRIAQDYFDIDLEIVWDTVQTVLPSLLEQLPAPPDEADDEHRNQNGGNHG
jgi:uncharacterized protein with HEPN domain